MEENPFSDDGSSPRWGMYTVLGVERTATIPEINKAYRKKALRLHPDKVPEERRDEQWQRQWNSLQKAHDTLSDPGKRRVYDEFGEQFLGLVDNSQLSEEDLSVLMTLASRKLSAGVCGFSVVFYSLLITGTVFAVCRDSGSIDWDWGLVFVPYFILLGLLWIVSVFFVAPLVWRATSARAKAAEDAARAASSSSSDPNPSDPPTSLHDEEDPLLRDDMPSAGAGATGTEAGSETGLSTAWKIALLIKCSALGILFSFLLLFLTLLTFALQGHLENSATWIIVFAPIFVLEIFNLIRVGFISTTEYYKMEMQEEMTFHGIGYVGFLVRQYYSPTLRIIFWILLVDSLSDGGDINYFIVFSPLLLTMVIYMVVRFLDVHHFASKAEDLEERRMRKTSGYRLITAVACCWILALSFLIMAPLWFMDDLSLAIVLIPLYIVILCACCCCLCVFFPLWCGLQVGMLDMGGTDLTEEHEEIISQASQADLLRLTEQGEEV